jgi:Biotin-requiring enzyme
LGDRIDLNSDALGREHRHKDRAPHRLRLPRASQRTGIDAEAPLRDRRRGMAQRLHFGRGRHAHRGTGVLRSCRPHEFARGGDDLLRLPALGADMEAGTLAEWHVKVGDRVKSGDIVARAID